jgi:hypothetical protein
MTAVVDFVWAGIKKIPQGIIELCTVFNIYFTMSYGIRAMKYMA